MVDWFQFPWTEWAVHTSVDATLWLCWLLFFSVILANFLWFFIPPIFINLFGRALMWNFDPTGPTHIIFFYTHLCSIIFKQKLYCEDWVVSPSSKGVHDFRFDLQHTITITSAWNTISTRRPKNGLFF